VFCSPYSDSEISCEHIVLVTFYTAKANVYMNWGGGGDFGQKGPLKKKIF